MMAKIKRCSICHKAGHTARSKKHHPYRKA